MCNGRNGNGKRYDYYERPRPTVHLPPYHEITCCGPLGFGCCIMSCVDCGSCSYSRSVHDHTHTAHTPDTVTTYIGPWVQFNINWTQSNSIGPVRLHVVSPTLAVASADPAVYGVRIILGCKRNNNRTRVTIPQMSSHVRSICL